MSAPEPRTAYVFPPASRHPIWASLSIPLAMPLIICIPCLESAAASTFATSQPYALLPRAPTIATLFLDLSGRAPM